MSPEVPEDCRIFPADTQEELQKVICSVVDFMLVDFHFFLKTINFLQFMWIFKEQHLSVPHWRSQRPYLMSHEVFISPSSFLIVVSIECPYVH